MTGTLRQIRAIPQNSNIEKFQVTLTATEKSGKYATAKLNIFVHYGDQTVPVIVWDNHGKNSKGVLEGWIEEGAVVGTRVNSHVENNDGDDLIFGVVISNNLNGVR